MLTSPEQEALHSRDVINNLETGLLQNASGACILGTGECSDFGQLKDPVGQIHAGPDEFRRVTLTPGCRREEIADLDTPSRFERIVVQATPPDDAAVRTCNDCPGRIAIMASAPFVNRNPAPAAAQRCVMMGMPHRIPVTQKPEQRWHIGKRWWTQQQARRFELHQRAIGMIQ